MKSCIEFTDLFLSQIDSHAQIVDKTLNNTKGLKRKWLKKKRIQIGWIPKMNRKEKAMKIQTVNFQFEQSMMEFVIMFFDFR